MEYDMKSRLTKLRETLELTKSKFAEKLGLTYPAISLIESGRNALTDQNINLICLTFKVNETWLRTGRGPMFNQAVPGEGELLDIFRKLSPHMRQSILKITQDLLEAQEKADTLEIDEAFEAKNRA
ncbi:MAG: helix-turn-helix domain-containing protein [Treponema sp.]|jgi:transcriptional regulator with XRE-family HTH domain|nr:helix-turn-helix domain-containing protein [Treponema sp.]